MMAIWSSDVDGIRAGKSRSGWLPDGYSDLTQLINRKSSAKNGDPSCIKGMFANIGMPDDMRANTIHWSHLIHWSHRQAQRWLNVRVGWVQRTFLRM